MLFFFYNISFNTSSIFGFSKNKNEIDDKVFFQHSLKLIFSRFSERKIEALRILAF